MSIRFIVPAPMATISGGYDYVRRVISGLRAAGQAVDAVELVGLHPLADAAAMQAARTVLDTLPQDTVLVIDGLALPAFAGLGDALAARGAVGLVHHPVSLETGLSDADAACLHSVEQALLGRLARVVATSETTREKLVAEFDIDRERTRVVAPGIDDAPRSTGSGGPGCAIISVGTLVPRKGHDVLIRSLARLFDLDWHLTIVGAPRDPVHAATLRALAEERGVVQRVTFAGELDAPALDALWQRADLFALATHYEGYGLAIAEALKRGLPVAVTSGGAAGALVTPGAGVVCAPGDEVTLAKSLRRLIFDTALRAEAAGAAWEIGQALPGWVTQARAFAAALA